MTVKNLLAETARLVGRHDLANNIEKNYTDDETSKLKRTLNFCLNAVVDELARGYFPVSTESNLTSVNGDIYFATFPERPVRILDVVRNGESVDWVISADHLHTVCGDVCVFYEYVPKPIEESREFSYPDIYVNEILVIYGMAAEYCLINGEISESTAWESKYRSEIDRRLSAKPIRGRIPPRRWL